MRILKINNTIVDIDDQTTIGIDYQSFDIKQPGKRFVNVSNSFNIPLTAKNHSIFGNAGNSQSVSLKPYQVAYCSYWIDNEKFIENAKCRIEAIQDRINIFIFEKKDIWDQLKVDKWNVVTSKYCIYLINEKRLYSTMTTPYSGTFQSFIDEMAASTEDLVLPMYLSNLRAYYSPSLSQYAESPIGCTLSWYADSGNENGKGGHFCAYVKSLFEYIEHEYGVDFLTAGGQVPGNIWDDPIATSMYIPMTNIILSTTGNSGSCTIGFNTAGSDDVFLPYKDLRDKADKTLYDFVIAFMQKFCLIKDEIELNGDQVIALRRFDALETYADIVNWSGGLSGIPNYKPYVDGYSQNNLIKFKSIYKNGDTLIGSRVITSLNLNLDEKSDLFEIDSHIPALLKVNNDYYYDCSEIENFKTFIFFVNGIMTTNNILVINWSQTGNLSCQTTLPIAQLYSLNSEYNLLEAALQYPKYYEIEKWLKSTDIRNLEFFKLYYFKELNGSFFLNKISGFNPDKSNQPTKLELLRVSDKTPVLESDFNPWVDGIDNNFVDGIDNILI